MTRFQILDELLSNRYHNYSIDDLTEEVNKRLSEIYPGTDGVVRRTIEKDINYLVNEGPFLAEIKKYSVSAYNPSKDQTTVKQCLRYADPSFSIFKKPMSAEEKYLLGEALSLLGQFDGLPNLEALENFRLGLGMGQEDRKIIAFTKNPLQNSNLLGELFTAISQRQVIELHYFKFDQKEKDRTVVIFPYLLKEYNRRWFVFGAAELGGKLLCYSLDRISKVVPLPSHKYVDYDGDINEVFEDIIGVTLFADAPLYKICFWVSDASCDYVATKPLHESQRNVRGAKENQFREKFPFLEGGRFFSIECRRNYELIRELSSFGKDLLVLEPKEVQDLVCERFESTFQFYQKLRT